MEEIWKTIEGYEKYQISNYGNVRHLDFHRQRYCNTIKQNKKPNGYKRVILSKEGITRSLYVHRLVASAFIPNQENKRCVNHKDGNRENNRVDNLEWVTHSENSIHSYRVLGYKMSLETITKIQKKRSQSYKMSEETKRKIGIKNREHSCKKVLCIELGKEFSSAAKASEWLGLTKKTVCKACRCNETSGGYHWKYLGEN